MAITSSEAPPSSPSETPTINNSTKSIPLENADQKGKKPLENNHHNAASSSGTTNEDDNHGGALSLPSEMIPYHLLPVISDLEKYINLMKAHVNQASEKFEELRILGSCERDFDELRRDLELKFQIPWTTMKDHHDVGHVNHGAALSLSSKMICTNLILLDSAFAKAKEYMYRVNVQINQAHEKFEKLQTLGGSQRDFDELRKAIAKLKFHIPSHTEFHSFSSNPHHDINWAVDGMSHFFHKEPEVAHTGDFDGLLKDFYYLPKPLHFCLLCFFKFPPVAIIQKRTMIYLWIGQGYISEYLHLSKKKTNPGISILKGLFGMLKCMRSREEYLQERIEELPLEEEAGNKIFDELIAKGFIDPIKRKGSLVPDSCSMNVYVRSSLYDDAKVRGFTSNGAIDYLDPAYVYGGRTGRLCLINVGETIINFTPEAFKNIKHIRSLHLGRWNNSVRHHIELANAEILHGLKKLKSLKFLSLRGISKIRELSSFILELNDLEILDFRDCHNLEVIPDKIGLLKSLTHLDMSECRYLEHMPVSLAQLSNLQVLKGFLIVDFNSNKQSCTLHDLSRLQKLRKLNIYVSVNLSRSLDFDGLEKFKGLQKLTISWRGYFSQYEIHGEGASMAQLSQSPLTLPPKLQKLDLRCFPSVGLIDWLRPAKGLKKLYIRGGQLYDLGESRNHQGEHWNVEILRLKYLSNLNIDWSELRILFPELIYLHQVECPKLTNFPCDESGVWMDKNAIYIQEQLQKYSRTCGIGSSSMVESGPTLDQDD